MKKFIIASMIVSICGCNNNSDQQKVTQQPGLQDSALNTSVQDSFYLSENRTKFSRNITEVITEVTGFISAFEAKAQQLKKDTIPLEGRTAEGGEMIVSTDKILKLKKYAVTEFAETGRLEYEFYLNRKNELQFVHFIKSTYNKPVGVEGSKVIKSQEASQIYFGNYLVAILDSNKKIQSVSPAEQVKMENEAKRQVKEYLAELKKLS